MLHRSGDNQLQKLLAANQIERKPAGSTATGTPAGGFYWGFYDGLAGHLECPVCGLDIAAMPAGIALPTTLPTDQTAWSLPPELAPEVTTCIAAQVHATLDRQFDVPTKAARDKFAIGKAMAAVVTGETIRAALEHRSIEWMCWIDGSSRRPTDGVAHMEKQLLQWLRSEVNGGGKWGKPRLLETLREQCTQSGGGGGGVDGSGGSGGSMAFKNGEQALAHWMVVDPTDENKIIVDPAAPSWLSGKVLGKGKGQGPCFKVKFADGYTHPGVPYAHIRRLEQA